MTTCARRTAAGEATTPSTSSGHRRVRRPVTGSPTSLRQGRPHRPADGHQRHQRGPGAGHAARAAHGLVPQHLVLGPRRGQAGADRHRQRPRSRWTHPYLGTLELMADEGPDGTEPELLFCENETNLARLYGATPTRPTPRTASTTTWCTARPTVNPEQPRHQVRRLVPADVAPGGTVELRLRLRPTEEPGRPRRSARRSAGPFAARRKRKPTSSTPGSAPRTARADAAHVMRQAFAGLLWCKQFYYYDVARWLDGDPAQPPAAARPPARPQHTVAELQHLRHHVHAGQVGVPLVRGLGPCLPLRGPGPHRPGVRQVPADPAVPGVVPAPERRAARLRVGLRRRQPAGAGLGRVRSVRHRRRP